MSNKATVSFTHLATAPYAPRAELRDALGLTGCEVSINSLPAGVAIPFVHTHKENEEVYLVLEGSGDIWLDGVVHPLKAGDAVRVDPSVERCMRASDAEPLTYVCIQAKQYATPNVTRKDGIVLQKEIQWR